MICLAAALAFAAACTPQNPSDPGNDPSGNNGTVTKHGKVGDPVDLGLSVKWATWNVGSSTPYDYGDYFAWGEVETRGKYTKDDYKWYDKETGKPSKYIFTDGGDGLEVLQPEDDAAHVQWGGNWRMPTAEEMDELMDPENCDWEWETNDRVVGFRVISKKPGFKGQSIFLPAGGGCSSFGTHSMHEYGLYWTSTLHQDWEKTSKYAYYLSFTERGYTGIGRYNYAERIYGYCIRPVMK